MGKRFEAPPAYGIARRQTAALQKKKRRQKTARAYRKHMADRACSRRRHKPTAAAVSN